MRNVHQFAAFLSTCAENANVLSYPAGGIELEEPLLTLRAAAEADEDAVLRLYADCVRAGHTHWTDEYPDRESAEEDLRSRTLYVCEHDGRIMGAVSLLPTDDCEELGLPYAPGKACVLCRLGVAPGWQGRGLGKRLLSMAEEQARKLGYAAMHLMCEENAARPRRLYEGAGYRPVGPVALYGHRYTAYEKLL